MQDTGDGPHRGCSRLAPIHSYPSNSECTFKRSRLLCWSVLTVVGVPISILFELGRHITHSDLQRTLSGPIYCLDGVALPLLSLKEMGLPLWCQTKKLSFLEEDLEYFSSHWLLV